MEERFEPDGHDVLIALRLSAAAGDGKAAAFLPVFEEWMVGQEVAEDVVSRFLGLRAL